MKTFKTVTTQELMTVACDSCGLQASAEGDYEFHEFFSIAHHCGYGSIHGDGRQINIDLCQQCFADMCGDALRITDESNPPAECIESSDKEQFKYSNTFDVICQSKTKEHQLKQDCDLTLAAREILSKNKVADNNELKVALKRVEQLWDAQYQSAEGNELHQLADLICVYEKKDWDSYFEEAPLADDDFMSDRGNFKSSLAIEGKGTACGILSGIPINTDIDDNESRDSAITGNNEGARQQLLESIAKAWTKYPELRFAQLIVNAISPKYPCPDIFHLEDIELTEKLNQL